MFSIPAGARRADSFLKGGQLAYAEADALWRERKAADDLSRARQVLARIRNDAREGALVDGLPPTRSVKEALCLEEALLTSKDLELPASQRHDRALAILAEEFDLDDAGQAGNAELFGIAGGIVKRRWQDLGQLGDLQRAAALYRRGADGPVGSDGYCQINAAFLDDLLARTGDRPDERQADARRQRERVVAELPALDSVAADDRWWNAASRAEALFGLGRHREATDAIRAASGSRPEPWKLQTTARQIGHLAQLQHERPLDDPQIVAFFDALVPGSAAVPASAVLGKVGLALSGGGFRASFYHLGVLARMAELDMLRHVDVLSCVSGGSIVGACYWLLLRERLLASAPLAHADYLALVERLIGHFGSGVAGDLRRQLKPGVIGTAWKVLKSDQLGAVDPEDAAAAFDEHFYAPLTRGVARRDPGPVCLHDLDFVPADHDAALAGSVAFNPAKHNWLRRDKVPALVINATAMNTGHAWQFTPTWMGESPWAVHEAADSVPRLEWARYADHPGWKMALGRAVAASACVPGLFAPLTIDGAYEDGVRVRLVDGGVHDNQGTVALLAQDCNVVLVSDACGQLRFDKEDTPGVKGLAAYAKRSMDVLMERIRRANHADLAARRQSGLLSGLMFLHMKAGLDAGVVRRTTSQQSVEIRRTALGPSGVRQDFQAALAELRTDLDAFTDDEQNALMACGYRMAAHAIRRDLGSVRGLCAAPLEHAWRFDAMLDEICSTDETTPRREALLEAFRAGG